MNTKTIALIISSLIGGGALGLAIGNKAALPSTVNIPMPMTSQTAMAVDKILNGGQKAVNLMGCARREAQTSKGTHFSQRVCHFAIEPIELGLSREQSAAMDKIWP